MEQQELGEQPAGAVHSAAPQVAIIVPVYNVVPYLTRCIDSLIAQTIPVELVLVDDGSTDASGVVLDWYAERHPNVRVLHQHNQGQGAARNAGLAASQAPFVAFVDSDDFVTPDYAEKLLTAVRRSQADIAVCEYTFMLQNNLRFSPHFLCLLPPTLTGNRALKLSIRDMSMKSYTWNKLFRRTLFTERNITFPSMIFEDMATMPRLFSRARRVAIVHKPLYTYYRRTGSLMGNFTPKRLSDNITALGMVRDYLIESGLFRKNRGSYTFVVHKFAFTMMSDTLYMHFKHRLPHPLPSAWASYRHALQLTHPAVDPNDTIEAIVRGPVGQAFRMAEK